MLGFLIPLGAWAIVWPKSLVGRPSWIVDNGSSHRGQASVEWKFTRADLRRLMIRLERSPLVGAAA